MHVKDQRVFEKVEALKVYIDQCDTFATEIELEGAVPSPTDFLIPNGGMIYQYVKPKKYLKWKKIVKKTFNLNLDQYVQHLPLLILSMISESMLQSENEVALDNYLSKYALQKGKRMLGVENFQEHIDVLKLIPIDFQIKALNDVLRNVKAFRKQVKLLTKYYLSQDIYKLYKAAKHSLQDSRKVMLYERNFKMADSIEVMINQQSTFIAVGAGHMAGKKGLIKLLKDKGFKLRPLLLG